MGTSTSALFISNSGRQILVQSGKGSNVVNLYLHPHFFDYQWFAGHWYLAGWDPHPLPPLPPPLLLVPLSPGVAFLKILSASAVQLLLASAENQTPPYPNSLSGGHRIWVQAPGYPYT